MADDGDDGGDNGPKTAKQLRFELSNLVKQETQHNRTIDELRTAHRTRAETIDSLTARIASVEEELGAGGGAGDAAGDAAGDVTGVTSLLVAFSREPPPRCGGACGERAAGGRYRELVAGLGR